MDVLNYRKPYAVQVTFFDGSCYTFYVILGENCIVADRLLDLITNSIVCSNEVTEAFAYIPDGVMACIWGPIR